jgi:hypothetical protein
MKEFSNRPVKAVCKGIYRNIHQICAIEHLRKTYMQRGWGYNSMVEFLL